MRLMKEEHPKFEFEGNAKKVDIEVLLWNAIAIADNLSIADGISFMREVIIIASAYAHNKK
jgi:hypothetical protein